MTKPMIVVTATVRIVLSLGAISTTPALAAGSDVVHYPAADAYRNETIEPHYEIGVPMPRLRAFDKASWAGSSRQR